MGHDSARLMLSDLSRELVEMARAAKKKALDTQAAWDEGRHFALYEVVSLISAQASAFGLDAASIGLAGVDPDRDLL